MNVRLRLAYLNHLIEVEDGAGGREIVRSILNIIIETEDTSTNIALVRTSGYLVDSARLAAVLRELAIQLDALPPG